ncbi:MAG: hypothetical protein ACK5WD_06070 [bacterium]|jgi:hypothetical protein
MSAIRLNGQYCLLRDIEKKDFVAFVNLVLPKITATEPIPHTAANVVASLIAEGKSDSDPVVQAGLQSCASLGIKNMWVDGGNASVTEETPTDAAAGLETAFGFAAVQSGLALAAAMCNAFRRKIKVNEQEIVVVRQSRELMMQIAQRVSALKQVNEPVFVTAGRLLGGMMKEGKAFDAPETMTVLCMLSDLGATAVQIDIEKGILGFGQFSPANAMSSAILQGLDPDKVKMVRESIEKTNEQFRRVAEQQAGGRPGGQPPNAQRLAVPSVIGTRRRR